MSPLQQKIYDFIVEYIMIHQYPPTTREIAPGVGVKAHSTVYVQLQEMIKNRIIESDAGLGTPRAIRVPELVITRRDNGKMEQ